MGYYTGDQVIKRDDWDPILEIKLSRGDGWDPMLEIK
jgi:hypothetical protein